MKNIVLSAVAVLAMSSFAVAGGDIAPVEEPIVVAEPVITDSGFYLGLAYGWQNVSGEDELFVSQPGNGSASVTNTWLDTDTSAIMVQAGYKFNSYVAIEGRYWFGLDTTADYLYNYADTDVSLDSFGIYVKPMYPVTDAFDIYALLGYGSTELSATATTPNVQINRTWDNADGFSWGLGASYAFTDNVAIFVDYVNIYDDQIDSTLNNVDYSSDFTVDTWNFGVTYQF